MSSEDARSRKYKDDPRIPCQYGVKCYQKNPQHHSKYKHPPKEETMKREAEKTITGVKRKNPLKDDKKKTQPKSPQRKLQKIREFCERNLHDISPSPERSDKDSNKDSNVKTEASDKGTTIVQTSSDQYNHSLESSVERSTVENVSTSNVDAEKIIMDLFLVEMPIDFFQFYEFCKSISKDNPLLACKSVCLKLVGPYDVLDGKIKSSENASDKEKFLIHWRYYYDPPEFQTIIKCDDKEGLHFGYWRDSATEKPVFVAKNRANVNCIFEPVAENVFGAVDAYLQDKAKSANPFEKTGIMRLHSQLKNFAKQRNIILEKNTVNMRSRERRVVARTFHRAGIVVPYEKKTQLGYRDLAATDNDLQKILKQIEEAGTSDERKTPFAKLDEIKEKEREMSKLGGTDLTAGGDASVVEKTDCADDAISLSIEAKCREDEAAAAEEVSSVSTLNVQAETERSVETTNEEVANPNAAEDAVIPIDAQESEVKSLTAIAPRRNEETPQSGFANNEEKADNSKHDARSDYAATRISGLEAEVRKRTKERDDYRKKLEETETKLAALQTSYEATTHHDDAEDTLQRSVEQLRGQLVQTALMYEERNRVAANQESQINALNNQVASLKEVVSITRDLLQIRNMEVKQLQAEVDNMEKKISEERDRHNVMISKMDAAMRLNADLKKEYETQLSLFQSLREKYGEKITLLSAEKRALETAASAHE
ncbi:hypothetical protein RF55_407 [Lasius niger]|uniref:PBZ-type domain-containing protein n=1 Tax=Lasius niger TaxID=67767 RepID=A0A0J7L9Y2_LASNI|nr:hypothetical protein RF55_407 [Lasius niger]